ncbi:MAG: hypothetical protein DPW11_01015 [bacterium]|nr:hypothetical protein [bacterium]RIK52213.1 MAG: hypothetical protein DCC61_00290 [Candidatus Microgenomates bacterium]
MNSGEQESNKKNKKEAEKKSPNAVESKVSIEELLLVVFARRSVEQLKVTLESGQKISDEAMKMIVKRVSGEIDNQEQKDLLGLIVKQVEGKKDERDMARDNLAKLLQLQDENLVGKKKTSKKKNAKSEKPSKGQETDAEKLISFVTKDKKDINREGISTIWADTAKELGRLKEKSGGDQIRAIESAIHSSMVNTKNSIEKGLNEPMSKENKEDILKETKNLYDKYAEKNQRRNIAKLGWRERQDLKRDNIVIGRGMKIVNDFVEIAGDEKKVKDLFKKKTQKDYLELFAFMDLMEEKADTENFAELYEVSRRIQESWDQNIVEETRESSRKLTDEDRQEVKKRVKKQEIPELERVEDMVNWLIDNNVLNDEMASRMSEEQILDFYRNLKDTLEMRASGYSIGGGAERYRNVDYAKYLPELNEAIKKKWREAGLDVGKLGEAIPDIEAILNGSKDAFVNTNLPLEAKKILEDVIFQELLQGARVLVSESVDRNMMYYDNRATKYLTLLALRGLDTTLKDTVTNHMILQQLSFAWRNGYVDEELYGKVMDFWSRQGPEYRLFEEMKRNETVLIKDKEGKEVLVSLELNMHDFEGTMAQNVADEDKEAVGMPLDIDRSWGTVAARKTEKESMKSDRRVLTRRALINKYGIDEYNRLAKKAGGEENLVGQIVDNYGDYINRVYLYWIGTGRLGEIVGNASFDNNKFDLPQGIPEYYMKRDPRLLVWFLWKYTPVRVPEALFGLARMGLPSFHAANKGESAAHFIGTRDTTEGGAGSRRAFYDNNSDKFTSVQLDKFSEKFAKVFKKALYNDDEFTYSEKNPYFKAISHLQSDKYNPRRNNTETIDILLGFEATEKDDNFFEAISWEWAKLHYSHDKQLVNFLNSKASGRDKFKFFAKRFNDGFFLTTALKAKRGDDAKKYRFNYQGEDMKAVIEYANNPEPENLMKILSIVASIVGDEIGEARDANLEIAYEILKEREVGEALDVIKYNGGSVAFSNKDYVGANKGEFPLPEMTKVPHNPLDKDIPTHSTAAYRGLEHKVYEGEMLMKVLMRNARAANLYRDDHEYREKRKEAKLEYFKESLPRLHWDNKIAWYWNVLNNGKHLWDVVTFKKLTNYIAIEIFQLPPHLFWEWLFENSEKSWETTMKVFAGHGGH